MNKVQKTKSFSRLLVPSFIFLVIYFSFQLCFFENRAEASPSDWLGSGWTKRIKLEINRSKVNGSVLNFPVYVNLSHMPASFFDDIVANGADLRVTKSDGITQVAREVVFANRTSNAGELHFIANGTLSSSANETFYLYYGNGTATEPAANATYGKYNTWTQASYAAVWHLQESPTGTMYNSASSSYDCTSNGSMLSSNKSTGLLSGNGTSFDGTDDFLQCGDVAELNSVSKFSITSWAKKSVAGVSIGLSSKYLDVNNSIHSVFYSGNFYAYFNNAADNFINAGAVNDANWHHVSMVFNGNLSGNANRFQLYNNGNLLSLSYGGAIPATSGNMSGKNLLIAKDQRYGIFTTGNHDEVRVSAVARPSTWIKTEYSNQTSPSTFYSVGSAVSLSNPVVLSFSPTDDSIYADTADNLVITFDRNIDIQTGNIYIKKSSDNSTVETIDVTSGLVTGNGTTQITINPTADLARSNGYYLQIDASAFDDTGANSYAGINDTTTWNFTTSYWYSNSWTRRIKVTVNSSYVNGTVTNFPVYLKLSDFPSSFFDDVLANGADLRVTKSNGITEVAREVVWLNKTQNAGELYFVANGALTNSTDTAFYIYYKNSNATEPAAAATYGKYNTWAASSYVGVWHLNESPASAATLYNSASASYNCTSAGSMLSSNKIAGQLAGNGTSFDGTDDYLTCGDITALNSATKFTVTGWAKRASNGAFVSLLNKYNTSIISVDFFSTTFYGLIMSPTGSTATATSNDTNWHHIAMIFNGNLTGNANRLKAYDNAVGLSLSFSGTIPAAAPNLSGTSVFIGRDDYAGPYTNGRLDEIRVANVERSGSWVKTEYNNQYYPSSFYTVGSVNSIPDLQAPSVTVFSPADNLTGVSAEANLVITFDEAVDTQAANIYIKKSSDDSTIETIVANSGLVTGNGTTQITIDPSGTLEFNTSYYIQIDATAIKDTSGNSYAGISDTTTWNFSTSGWYNDAWTRRIPITINASYVNGTVTNFPVYVNLNGMPASFTNDILANGADLRVTKSDGSTEVAREVVFLNRTANAGELHFVANGTLTNSSNTIFYIYYKNPSATEPSASATYGKYNTWTPAGYVGVWHLNESPASAATLYNSASASYNCTSAGAMLSSNRVSGGGSLSGNGTSFDGSNDYLDCGDVNELDSVSKFTLSGWGKRASNSNHVVIGAKFTNGSARMEAWYYSDGNFYNIVGTGTYGYAANNNTSWHHTVMIYNGNLSTNATRAVSYIDGSVLTNSYSGTIPATTSNHSGNFFIGRSSAGSYTSGNTDEVRVSTKTFNGNWIKTEYNNQNAPNTFYTIGSADTHTDTNGPTVSSYSPTDNSTNVAIDTNLVITFDETVDTQSGNIYIKKSSDNSTVQTIAANSGSVTGNGTTQLTINPSDLAYNTSFYIQIASDAIKDSVGNSYAGIATTTTWNFTTVPQSPSDWLSGGFLYRTKMTIAKSQINGSIASFPVYVDLNGLPAHFYSNVNANGTDLRVTKSDGTTQVAREVVIVNRSATTGELHFLANGTLSNSSNGIYYLYYGNSSATEPSSSSSYGKYAVWNGNVGYAAVYHFQQDPSTTIYNSASGSYNCTSSGGMTTALNKVAAAFASGSNGYSFDGSNDYLDCGDVNELDSATKYTVTGWAKRNSNSNHVTIVDKYSDASNRMQSWYYNDGNYYAITGASGAAYGSASNNNTNWHHVVMIFNGSATGNSNRMKAYIDSSLLTLSFSGTIPAASANHSGNVNIGRANTASYTNGRIDEVRIARFARNGNWVKTEYNNQSAPSTFVSFSAYNDLSSPAALSFSPADGSTGVASSANLVITFERNIDIQTGNIYIKKLSDNSTVQTIDVSSGALSGNGTTQITINPPSDFGSLTAYYINIDPTAFDDTAGNSYAGITDNGTWNITSVGDSTAPTISSFSPSDNNASVAVAANLVMNFTESIDIQTGNVVIYNSNGNVFESVSVTGGAVTGDGTAAITINPTSNFAELSSYYVLISSGVFNDLAGNAYAGIAASTTWNFTTADATGPTVLHYSPAHNSILQQRYAGLRLIFSEAIQKGAGTIVIKKVSDDSIVASVNVSSATVVVSGNQLFVQMPDKLPEGIEFYVQMSAGLVKDLSNNDYAGIADTTSWRFWTSAAENSLFL